MGAFGSYDTDPENDDFVPGTTIRSSEVDANFDKLKNHLNSPFVDDACVAPDADIDGSKLADASIDASKFDPAINLTFYAEEEFFFSVPGETIVLAAGPLSTAQPVRLFSGAGQSGTEYDGPDTGGVIGAGGSADFTVDHAAGTVTHVGGGAVPVLTPVYLTFDGIAIPPLSVGTGELQNNAVTLDKMADNSVGSDEIINGSVGSDEIGTNAVGSDELADNAVDTAAIQDDAVTLDKLNDIGPAADNVIDYIDGTGQLIDTVVFTANGNFTKASYPDAKYVRVRAVGGGGGGGAADSTAANEDALGAFGGGGAYAERGPIDITTLPASVPVNVGPGGAGGTAGGAGTVGGESEFGIGGAYHTRAAGGAGGPGMPGGTGLISFRGGAGGLLSACLGDVISAGESGENSTRLPPAATGAAYAFCIPQGTSGGGPFGGSVRAPLADAAGLDGQGPGAGGSGGRAAGLGASDGGHTGGDGADGIVIVEVYS